jgi:four helix bundle protein
VNKRIKKRPLLPFQINYGSEISGLFRTTTDAVAALVYLEEELIQSGLGPIMQWSIFRGTFSIMKDEKNNDLVERTLVFGFRIVKMFVALPKTEEARVLVKQSLRSGTSVGANYREAQRARSTAEFIAKIGDCLKELDETSYWLELLVRSEIVTPRKLAALRQENEELLAIFTTISKNAKR